MWTIQTIASLADLPPLDAVSLLMVPLNTATRLADHPVTVPVLGYGPADLLEMAPTFCCDDLLAEPWTSAELRFRVGRIVRRSVKAGGDELAWSQTQLAADGRPVSISMAEYHLLDMLLRAHGGWVPREALAAAADVRQAGRALDMHISRLRRKIHLVTADWEVPPQLVTQRGFGYSLRFLPLHFPYHRPVDK